MGYSCEQRLGNAVLWLCLCQVVIRVGVYGSVVRFRETNPYYLFLEFPDWFRCKYKCLYFCFQIPRLYFTTINQLTLKTLN